jgi:hypothetical protein
MDSVDVVPIDPEHLVDIIDNFKSSEPSSLIVHFSTKLTRVDVERMAKLLAEQEQCTFDDYDGRRVHLSYDTMNCKYPMLVKGLGSGNPDIANAEKTINSIICLWTKLGYTDMV